MTRKKKSEDPTKSSKSHSFSGKNSKTKGNLLNYLKKQGFKHFLEPNGKNVHKWW